MLFVLPIGLPPKVLLEENDPAAPMLPLLTSSGTHARAHAHIHTPHPISSAALVSLLHFIKAESSDNYFHNELALQINANYTMQS